MPPGAVSWKPNALAAAIQDVGHAAAATSHVRSSQERPDSRLLRAEPRSADGVSNLTHRRCESRLVLIIPLRWRWRALG